MTLYLDIFSGISGDMFLGAMLDLGVEFDAFQQELRKLPLTGYHLHATRQFKSNIEGVKLDVHLESEDSNEAPLHGHAHTHAHSHSHSHSHVHDHAHEGRDFSKIKELIRSSELSDWVKEKALAVFHRVAVAEGKIHGTPPEKVHFHEVGAVDSIVDIVGACVALEMLGKPQVQSRPVEDGCGWVECAHGRFPVPTTATLEILGARGIAVTQVDEPHELVTPTGAALLAEFAESFGPMESLVGSKIGYGLGTRDLASRPNVLRAVLGEAVRPGKPSSYDWEKDRVAVLETNLDDTPAEILGHFVELAMAAGALEANHIPNQMKKCRPGVVLTVLCPESETDRFCELIMRETTALGVRIRICERRKLKRRVLPVVTPWGEVTVKVGLLNGQTVQVAPEFESCKTAALSHGVPLKQVYVEAIKGYYTQTTL